MRLPNANRAIVDEAKLAEYCLSSTHPRGKHKARRFAAFGITVASVPILKAALLEAAQTREVTAGDADEYGRRYSFDFVLPTAKGPARVRTAWIVRTGEDFPRLITCYIL